ncbi:MAG: hypothetical protein ACFE9V_18765 [Candidatus Hodarchaeota archaeon]
MQNAHKKKFSINNEYQYLEMNKIIHDYNNGKISREKYIEFCQNVFQVGVCIPSRKTLEPFKKDAERKRNEIQKLERNKVALLEFCYLYEGSERFQSQSGKSYLQAIRDFINGKIDRKALRKIQRKTQWFSTFATCMPSRSPELERRAIERVHVMDFSEKTVNERVNFLNKYPILNPSPPKK